MANKDPQLGKNVGKLLRSLNIESPIGLVTNQNTTSIAQLTHILSSLGLNVQDASIKDTPRRVIKMYQEELFYGLNYDNFPAVSHFNIGDASDNIVIERNVQIHSVCEHHLIPFIGVAHIAYIPNKKVVGLSKLNRITDFFARRPQVQERLTAQIKAALEYILDTQDVAVIISAEHMCVKLRGIKDQNSSTITSAMGGRFMTKKALRAELLTLIGLK